MSKHIAIYVRVSSRVQETKSQLPDLRIFAEAQEMPVIYYEDHGVTGHTMNRPAWDRLMEATRRGECSQIVVWRIDRLGRTARGLTALFAELGERKVNLVSLKDGIDLSTVTGRLVANLMASLAQWETELRGSRVSAGIDAARAAGKRWGGSKPGIPKKVSPEKEKMIRQLKADGTPITKIAAAVNLCRSTIYAVLQTAPTAAA